MATTYTRVRGMWSMQCFLLLSVVSDIRKRGFEVGMTLYILFCTGCAFFSFFFFLHYIFERAVRIGCTRPFACTVARNPKCYSTGIIRPSIATKLPFELIRVSTAQRRHYRTTDAAIYLEIVTMPFSLNGIRSRYKVRSYCRWDEAEFPASNVHH